MSINQAIPQNCQQHEDRLNYPLSAVIQEKVQEMQQPLKDLPMQ